MKSELTERQQTVLRFLSEHQEKQGYPPTVRELARFLGLRGPKMAYKYLRTLEEKGYLRRQARRSRGIHVRGQVRHPVCRLPILGQIRAGRPQLALEDIEGYLAVDAAFCKGPQDFFLRVKGGSMIEAHILEGDYVLVHPQATAEEGEMVVALVGEEATVKYFYREGESVRLQPAHPTMPPIDIHPGEGEVQILGKVVGVVRKI
ncbi:MAG: repressor LexA [Nitrospirae bacterium]|nr:repressor LexA [Nitrospirota bacterium]